MCLESHWHCGSSRFIYVNCIYLRIRCLRFLYHMMFVSCNSSTTGATCGAETANSCEAHEFTPAFNKVRVSRSSVFCIMFCRSLFVLFGGSLYCLSYDLFIWLPIGNFKLFFLDFSFIFYSSSVIFLYLFLCSFLADRKLTESTNICIIVRLQSLNPTYSQFN